MRTICCVCHVETKPEDGQYPHNDSHGYCPKHLAEARAAVAAYAAQRAQALAAQSA